MRIARILLPVSILLFAVLAQPASASTQIGQLLAPHEVGGCTGGGATVETAIAPGTTPYTVPAGGGVITAWGTRTGISAGKAKLKVWRPVNLMTGEYEVVGEDGPHDVAKNSSPVFSSGVRIPVKEGDAIGMVTNLGTDCYFYLAGTAYHFASFGMGTDPAIGAVAKLKEGSGAGEGLELIATVEPDTDHDGYGDETQDACLNNSLGHELPCPALPAPPDTRAPRITLNSKTTQGAKKAVVAIATADEDVTFKASGSVNVPGAGAFSLVPREAAGAANSKTSLSLGISKKARGKIAAALKKGKKVRASVHVVAKDAAGNTSNATQSITIAKSVAKKHH